MSQAMLKFGLAPMNQSLLNSKVKFPPLSVPIETACKCPNGTHTVWTNSLWGAEPTCHCEPNAPTTVNTCQPPSSAPTAGAGYRYYWSTDKCQWIMMPDYELPSNIKGGQLTYPLPETSIFNTSGGDLLQQLKDFFNNHKLLVIAGAAGLGYLALSGGLSASDRTVTSVTRYAPKRKNGLSKRNGKRSSRRRK